MIFVFCAVASAQANVGSVALQGDAAHDGDLSGIGLAPPLNVRWTRTLGAGGGYAVIADGRVFVTAKDPSHAGYDVIALDEATGATLWVQNQLACSQTYLAYDAGRVFSNCDGVEALDAITGAPLWNAPLDSDQYVIWDPPTASGGIVVIAGDGYGSAEYAFRESDGARLWRQPTASGADGAQAMDGSRTYVSQPGQDYAFDSATGAPAWHWDSGGYGGGGLTPALWQGRLYTRDTGAPPDNTGLHGEIFDAPTGALAGRYYPGCTSQDSGCNYEDQWAGLPAAMWSDIGLFSDGTTLRARSLADDTLRWTFTANAAATTPPLVVDGLVYLVTRDGLVVALDPSSGAVVWSGQGPGSVRIPDEHNLNVSGLAAGDGLLVVPTDQGWIAYGGSPAGAAQTTAPSTVASSGQAQQTARRRGARPVRGVCHVTRRRATCRVTGLFARMRRARFTFTDGKLHISIAHRVTKGRATLRLTLPHRPRARRARLTIRAIAPKRLPTVRIALRL